MASTLKGSGEPDVDNLLGQTGTDDATAHDQEIGVIVKAAHSGSVELLTEGGANTWKTIGRDGHTQAGAADQDAATVRIRQDGLDDLLSIVRIVDGDFFTITPQILHGQRQALQQPDNIFF